MSESLPSLDTAVPDVALVAAAREGDNDAFAQLVRRHQEKVYMLALQLTHNHSDADELSQQAFVKAFQALDQFQSKAGFFTWIYRITVNLCLTHLKNRNRTVELPGADDDEDHPGRPEIGVMDTVDDSLQGLDAQREVWAALDQLTPDIQAAVVLVYLQDMSPREASRSLGCAEATVHWRLFKARKLLKRILA